MWRLKRPQQMPMRSPEPSLGGFVDQLSLLSDADIIEAEIVEPVMKQLPAVAGAAVPVSDASKTAMNGAQADLGRTQVLRAGDVLRARQLLETEEGGDRAEDIELAWRIVDQRPIVADDEGVALPASKHRPGKVVNIGEVVPICKLPCRSLIFDVEVQALAAIEAVEDLRIGSVEDPDVGFSNIGGVAVAEDGRVYVIEAQDRQIRIYGANGTRLGPYEVEHLIAAGGMGEVEQHLGVALHGSRHVGDEDEGAPANPSFGEAGQQQVSFGHPVHLEIALGIPTHLTPPGRRKRDTPGHGRC